MNSIRILFLLLLSLGFSGVSSAASNPFRLLTTEAAENPSSVGVAGLQELGINLGPVFIDTNPLYDVLTIGNLGAKFVYSRPEFSVTAGARYLNFFGSSIVESQIKKSEPRIDSFRITASGVLGFVGVSRRFDNLGLHFNFQYADISGSRITSPVFAADVAFSENWAAVGELGYDFANRQPRASLGVVRNGPNFGARLGLTYIKIDDAFLRYTGVAPIIDFFWLIGGSQK